MLASEPLERLHLLRPPQLRFGPLGHMQVVRQVTVASVVGALAALQLLQCKVTDRGQHRVAGFAGGVLLQPHQAVVDECCQTFEDVRLHARVSAHRLSSLGRAAAIEHAEASECRLLVAVEQVVAPHECPPQRLLTDRQVQRAGLEQAQAIVETLEQHRNWQAFGAGGRQLEREGKPIEPGTQLDHDGCVAVGQLEVGPGRARTLGEQGNGRVRGSGCRVRGRAGAGHREWGNRERALRAQLERSPTGGQDRDGWAVGQLRPRAHGPLGARASLGSSALSRISSTRRQLRTDSS